MDRLKLVKGCEYAVRDDHPFFPGRRGFFAFWGGPDADVAVLANSHGSAPACKTYICVGPDDIVLLPQAPVAA